MDSTTTTTLVEKSMFRRDKLLIVVLTLAIAACATESRPFKWRQIKGSIGFEQAESYCKNQDEIYRDNLATSILGTLISGHFSEPFAVDSIKSFKTSLYKFLNSNLLFECKFIKYCI